MDRRPNARVTMGNDARLASLEADSRNMGLAIEGITERLDGFGNQLNRIESKQAASGTTNWATLAAWAGVIFIAIGAIGSFVGFAFVARLQSDELAIKESAAKIELVDDKNERYDKDGSMKRLEIQIAGERYARDLYDRVMVRVNNLERDSAKAESELRLKTKEIETQFGWMCDAVNQDRAHRVRMEGIIYRKAFEEELPILHINPIGPRRHNSEGTGQ